MPQVPNKSSTAKPTGSGATVDPAVGADATVDPAVSADATVDQALDTAPDEVRRSVRVRITGAYPLYHPYQDVTIREHPVPLELDNWLEVQKQAGLVEFS